MGTVLLVRHAETAWNRAGRVQGWAPTTLTDRGREQARALATHLSGATTGADTTVDRVIASDLRRARQTARVIETATRCRPAFDDDWRERNFGALQGLPAEELFDRHPQLSLKHSGEAAARARPEGGETLLETEQRVRDAWRRLRADLAVDERVVVVSHSGPISLLLGELLDQTLTEAVFEHQQENGAVTELRVDDDGVRVVRENWTAYRTATAEA